MKRFRYKARDSEGQVLSGEIVAEDHSSATLLVQEAGFFVISIEEAKFRRRWSLFESGSIPVEERLFLLQAWAVLLNAGFSMQSALLQLQKGTRVRSVERTLNRIERSIAQGMTLSEAVAASKLFPYSWISALSVAEKTGSIIETLHALRERALNFQKLKRELLMMMIIPSVLFALTLVWVWVFIHLVVPAMLNFSSQVGVVNPWLETLASFSKWILIGLFWSVIAFGVFLLGIWRAGKSNHEIGLLQASIPIGFPMIGPLVSRLHLVDFASALKLQLEAGIPIVEAVQTISRGIPHAGIRRDLYEAYQKLQTGAPVSEAFQNLRILPPEAYTLIKTGEMTGELPDLLAVLINETQAVLTQQTERLAIILRTLVMILVGILVGLLTICFWLLFYSNYDSFMKGIEASRSGPAERALQAGS